MNAEDGNTWDDGVPRRDWVQDTVKFVVGLERNEMLKGAAFTWDQEVLNVGRWQLNCPIVRNTGLNIADMSNYAACARAEAVLVQDLLDKIGRGHNDLQTRTECMLRLWMIRKWIEAIMVQDLLDKIGRGHNDLQAFAECMSKLRIARTRIEAIMNSVGAEPY